MQTYLLLEPFCHLIKSFLQASVCAFFHEMHHIAVMHNVERISDEEERVFAQMEVKVFASFASFLSVVLPSVSSAQVYETPFFVAVDHEKKKVVISIRGTLSLKVNFSFSS